MLERNSFYQTLASRRFSSDTKTGMGVLLILEYMIYRLDINIETKLTFDLLRENVSRTIPDDDFISAVFYLTRKEQNVGALRQIIEAHDPKTQTTTEISPQVFSASIEGGNYIHPITLEPVDEATYAEQVITYFVPTPEFLLSVAV